MLSAARELDANDFAGEVTALAPPLSLRDRG